MIFTKRAIHMDICLCYCCAQQSLRSSHPCPKQHTIYTSMCVHIYVHWHGCDVSEDCCAYTRVYMLGSSGNACNILWRYHPVGRLHIDTYMCIYMVWCSGHGCDLHGDCHAFEYLHRFVRNIHLWLYMHLDIHSVVFRAWMSFSWKLPCDCQMLAAMLWWTASQCRQLSLPKRLCISKKASTMLSQSGVNTTPSA